MLAAKIHARRGLGALAILALSLGSVSSLWAQGSRPSAKPAPGGAKTTPKTPAKKDTKKTAPAQPEEPEEFPYEKIDVPGSLLEDTPKAKALKRELDMKRAAVLRGEASLEDAQTRATFDNYYARYWFAVLTHPNELASWPERRVRFFRDISASNVAENAPVHDHLVKLTFDEMSKIAKGNYHPAARYNAVIFIANLNDTEPILVGERKRPPVPYINGLAFMLTEFNNPQQIDAVRVGALVGIQRHVDVDRQLGAESRRLVNNNAEKRIVDLAVGLLTAKDPPPDRLREGHNWMRRRAADILGLLGSLGDNGKALTALTTVLGDATEPVSLRCSAAEAVGRLSFAGKAVPNLTDLSKKYAILAAFACYKEISRVEEQQEREQKPLETTAVPSGDMYGQMEPGFAPGQRKKDTSDPLSYRTDLSRRRVKDQLLYLKRGLLGPKWDAKEPPKAGLMALAKPGKDQDYMKTVVEAIDDIIKVADDQSFKQVTALIAPLRKAARDLEDKCKVVAELPESEKSPPEKPGADPLDTLGLEAAAKKPVAVKPAAPPGVKPAAPAEGKPPGAKPAAPAPAPAAPTAPAKPETPPAQPAPPAAK
jgi:hypothetical protein